MGPHEAQVRFDGIREALMAGRMTMDDARAALSALPYRVDAWRDGLALRGSVLYPPALPSRRRSAPLSRYDRLAPPIPDHSAWA